MNETFGIDINVSRSLTLSQTEEYGYSWQHWRKKPLFLLYTLRYHVTVSVSKLVSSKQTKKVSKVYNLIWSLLLWNYILFRNTIVLYGDITLKSDLRDLLLRRLVANEDDIYADIVPFVEHSCYKIVFGISGTNFCQLLIFKSWEHWFSIGSFW